MKQKQLKSGKSEYYHTGISWSDSGFSRWRCTESAVRTKESTMPAPLSAMVQSSAALQGKSFCQVILSMQAQQMNSLPGTQGFIFLRFLGTSWAQAVTELTPVWALVAAHQAPAQTPPLQVLPEYPPALGFCCLPSGELEWGILWGSSPI